MVPRLARAGTSFKSAGLYYLHDKDAATDARVAFTHTENMLTDRPDAALKVMAFTAMHQKELKASHYVSLNPDDPHCENMNRAGRPTKTSVLHYSLSWHPSETPDQEHMIEAARASLKKLGLQGHETLMVAHNDEPQAHIHLIVNKIHPETGRVAPLKYTKERLSKWAQAYEEEHGHIWCEDRVKNNAKRLAIDEFAMAHDHAPENAVRPKDHLSFSKADYYQWKRLQRAHDWKLYKGAVNDNEAEQKSAQVKLFKVRDKEIRQAMACVREEMRPHWAAYFRQEKAQKKELERILSVPAKNLAYFLKNSQDCVRFEGGWMVPAFNAMSKPKELRAQFEAHLAAKRKVLSDTHERAAKTAVKMIHERHRGRIRALQDEQRRQRFEFRKKQEELRDQRAKEAEQKFREQRVIDAIASAIKKRDGVVHKQDFAEASRGKPLQTDAPPDIVAPVAQRPIQPVQPLRGEQFSTTATAPPIRVGRGQAPPTPAKQRVQRTGVANQNDPPRTPYGLEPRRMPHPKGLRRPPVAMRSQEDAVKQQRQTLLQAREQRRKREDAELLAIFGSVSRVQKFRARAADGKVITKVKGDAIRGRGRRRGFD